MNSSEGRPETGGTGRVFALAEPQGGRAGISTLRREIKFAMPRSDVGKLRSILDVNLRPVRYRNETSRIASLYFDDAQLSSCRLNVDGTSRRSKMRLRWYDSPLPERELFFEVKTRRGDVLGKERLALRSTLPRGSLPLRGLADELARLLPGAESALLMARSEPILITEYERRYFEAPGEPMRFTIDSDLVFYAQLGERRVSRRFGERVPDLAILEVKAPVGSEGRLREVLHPIAPWVSRSSKYVMGCHYLRLFSGGGYGSR
jgi:hypothetical protein